MNVDSHRSDRFTDFVAWFDEHITGDEKGESQTFLNRLFQAFGQQGVKEAGAAFEFRVQKRGGGTRFADLVWPELVLIEMKKRGEDLSRHTDQLFDYWKRLNAARGRYAVLCNFDELWVYDFLQNVDEPIEKVKTRDLPGHHGPLAFLFPTQEDPKFHHNVVKVTREAAASLSALFKKLIHPARRPEPVPRDRAQRFVLQCLVALFAEDIGLLPEDFFTDLLVEAKKNHTRSYDLIHGLFAAMNTEGGVPGGRYKGVAYFNGGVFAESAAVDLDADEVTTLLTAAKQDWSPVRPEIFGTVFEDSLDEGERHAYGAHFTSGVDIKKIIDPTIAYPWREAIEKAAKGKEPVKNLELLRARLLAYRVLDPACGSGNFLYAAYRELKRIERELLDELGRRSKVRTLRLGGVTARQFFGMDVNPFAIELAKVTMSIARKLAIDETHLEEEALPLHNLDDNFRVADALITPVDSPWAPPPLANARTHDAQVQTAWPECDVIVGNPPFLGAKRLKPERGGDYVDAVRALYPDVPGMADYCVYWVRRSHDHLPACTPADPLAGRAGLVGTQNIRNNQSRVGGLDHVVDSGTVVDAVENQPWSGAAAVHVSIANWVKRRTDADGHFVDEDDDLLIHETRSLHRVIAGGTKKKKRRKKGDDAEVTPLEVREVPHINASLSDKTDVSEAKKLRSVMDPQRCFNGQYPRHAGFRITPAHAKNLVATDPRHKAVVHPYMAGAAILTIGKPIEAVIDFKAMDQLEARSYEAAFTHLEAEVLPHVEALASKEQQRTGSDTGQDQTWLEKWWLHFRARGEMREAFEPLQRYMAVSRVTKRPIFVFLDCEIVPDSGVQAFALEDDYSFGVIQSRAHTDWFFAKSSKLKSDFRYSPSSIWDTFPWPQSPASADVEAVAAAAVAVRGVRADALTKIKGGLRGLYRTLDKPGKNPLRDAHAALDAAVLRAYGFYPKADLLASLLDLNESVSAAEQAGTPVTAPGIPASFTGDPANLVTPDRVTA